VAYAYVIEPFMAWYSQDVFERQFAWWRATGFLAVGYWGLFVLNVAAPLLLFSKRIRRNLAMLLIIGAAVVVGMWAERYVIIIGSTAHDFMPHNWGSYAPRWPEYSITAGAFVFFLFWFLGFAKTLPAVPTADVKDLLTEEKTESVRMETTGLQTDVRKATSGVLAIFREPSAMLAAVQAVIQAKLPYDTFSPSRLPPMEPIYRPSPVRYWTFLGALAGLAGGFALAIGSALVNGLIVGGKMPVSIVPYCIIGFEGTILIGAISNLIGLLVHCHLGHSRRIPAMYDRRFSRDHFGLFIPALSEQMERATNVLSQARPEELHVIG
jgi:molybdopterin-containing oxidoreductase family membrane subunit